MSDPTTNKFEIEKIIYINLDERLDRREHIETILKDIDIPNERFRAIKPSTDQLLQVNGLYHGFFRKATNRIQEYVVEERTRERGLGVFGCYLSHYKVLCNNLNNIGAYLIIEDDVSFEAEFLPELCNTLNQNCMKFDWDIMRIIWNSENLIGLSRINQYVYQFDSPHNESKFSKGEGHNIFGGTHFQLINQNKSRKILEYLDSDCTYAIDSAYSTNKIKSFVLDLSSEIQIADFRTDIPKTKQSS